MFKSKKKIFDQSFDFIVVGLGNPGRQYECTRHNVGFMACDYIAEKYNAKIDKLKFKSLCINVKIKNKNVLLMKPSTFMNLSGTAVIEAMNFYKVNPENVIVIFDDVSLDIGKIRIRQKGSHGGHNGMKNIIYLSSNDKFPRIKIGVGDKPNPEWDLADWVLSKFHKDEMIVVQDTVKKVSDAVDLIVGGEINKAMNNFN